MADKRQEKERLRQARVEAEKRESSEQRRKLVVGYAVAGLLSLLVVAGIVYVIANGGGGGSEGGAHILEISGNTHGLELDEREGPAPPEQQEFDHIKAARAAGCVLREDLPDEGNKHLSPDDPPPDYKTNPATSGDHIAPNDQQADGAYLEMPEPVNFVHSLEHGRVLLQYNPELPTDQQLELRGLYDDMYSGALFFPNPEMPYDVAVTTWRNLLGCDSYEGPKTLDAVRSFGIEKFGDSPEPVEGFGPLEVSKTPATPGPND